MRGMNGDSLFTDINWSKGESPGLTPLVAVVCDSLSHLFSTAHMLCRHLTQIPSTLRRPRSTCVSAQIILMYLTSLVTSQKVPCSSSDLCGDRTSDLFVLSELPTTSPISPTPNIGVCFLVLYLYRRCKDIPHFDLAIFGGVSANCKVTVSNERTSVLERALKSLLS